MTADEFLAALAKRRTCYSLDKNVSATPERVREIVESAVLNTPSAFNSQSARAVILFGARHDRLWEITRETLRKIVPAENFAPTEEKLASFAAGAGTVLYFEDMDAVEALQKAYPMYKDNFPVWSLQANGMLEANIWTALASEGLGASLQHYNPLIDGAGTVLYFEDMSVVTGLQEQFPLYRDNFPIWSQQANGMLQENVWTAFALEGIGASLQHYNPLIDGAVHAQWGIPESWKLIAEMPFGNPTAPPGAKDSAPISERVRVFG